MTTRPPLLAEWACLGALYREPSHGFAVAKRLAADGDLGRIWHVSRPLTYRALEVLRGWGWIAARGEQLSSTGPNRTLLVATSEGRLRFDDWLATPVEHVRDVRSELLLKVVLADELGIDLASMLDEQLRIVDAHAETLDAARLDRVEHDVVARWRREMTMATQRFVGQLSDRRR